MRRVVVMITTETATRSSKDDLGEVEWEDFLAVKKSPPNWIINNCSIKGGHTFLCARLTTARYPWSSNSQLY